MRIGFLFNHEAGHQVAHALPVALALARLRPDIAVEILHSQGPVATEIARIGGAALGGCRLRPLAVRSRLARAAHRLLGNAIPLERVALLRDNLDAFRALDLLVVPEKTSLLLRARFGLDRLPLIYTSHGAGDGPLGFDRATGDFDLLLLPGEKARDRLAAAGLLARAAHAIIGYPKFDLVGRAARPALFDNGRPTVLYNPHPSPGLSSWYRMGRAILDYFAGSERYNLIFAPHVMLFRKRLTIALDPPSIGWVGSVPRRLNGLPHIRIDTGSPASFDMTYTLGADIYLGDASSQVYEFLIRPRPCVFADPRGRDWRPDPNFGHWRAGPVIGDIAGLDAALHAATRRPDAFRAVQREMFAHTFDPSPTPAAERAARAVGDFADRRIDRQARVGR